MKSKQVQVTMIIVVLVVAMVGYYAYLSGKARERRLDKTMSAVEIVLSRNLTNDYPPTPREVMKYYNEIIKCYYNEECTQDEIDDLGLRARDLYDQELLDANELGVYLIRLRQDVKDYKTSGRRITSAGVSSSTNVDFFEHKGYSCARILCVYGISEGGVSGQQRIVYLLRKDENKRWKIFGWDLEENVHIGGEEGSETSDDTVES